MNTSIPADRACSSRSTATIPAPETPKTITSTSSFTCSSIPCPVPNRTRLAFSSLLVSRVQITPTRSPAGTAMSLRFTKFFGLAEVPSPISRRHVQEADGVAEGLDRVADSGVTREHRPSLGFNVLIGGREPDTAFVDAQRDWTGRGVLIEPVTPSFITSSTTFKPSPLRSVIAFRLPSCHVFSSRKRVTSVPRSKLCSGPCKDLSDSGCGLVAILYPPSPWGTCFDYTDTRILYLMHGSLLSYSARPSDRFVSLVSISA